MPRPVDFFDDPHGSALSVQWICARDMWQQLHYASDVASKLADVTDQASWKQWALEACANGAGRAHRYTKDPSGWCPTVILDAGGGPTARPQAILASVVGEYAAIWEARQWTKSEIVDDVEWRMQHLGRGFPRQPWDPLLLLQAHQDVHAAKLSFKHFDVNFPSRVCIDVHKKVLASKKLSVLQRNLLRCHVCEGAWIAERLLQAGYLVDNVCPLCGCHGIISFIASTYVGTMRWSR